MVTVLPTIQLQPRKKTAAEIRAGLPTPLRILTSPKTTAALLATLGAVTFPAAAGKLALGLIPKTLGGVAKLAFVAGAISAVPSLVRTFNPFKVGQKAGPFIADPSLLLPKGEETLGEKVKDVALEAGVITAGVAALTGAAALIVKAAKRLKPGAPGLPGLPGLPGAPGVSLPVAMAPVISKPLGPVEKPEPEKLKAPLPGAPAHPINIKILNKPEINIRFSRSRKFINQQLLIR